MILFIYTASEKTPFEELFYPIGDYKKVILSNQEQQIKLFNQHEGAPIKELLPEGITDPADDTNCCIPPDDDSIFFIPLEMKDTFMKLLKQLFGTKWAEDKTTKKPSKDDIRLVGSDDVSQFYDNIEVQTVLKPEEIVADPRVAELKTLLDQIAQDENEIDVIFVANPNADITGILMYESTPTARAQNVDVDALEMQVKKLAEVFKITKQANLGELKSSVTQLSGGIMSVDALPGELLLYLISATPDGMEMFQYYRKKFLPDVKDKLTSLGYK
jgi:hypothetical protein